MEKSLDSALSSGALKRLRDVKAANVLVGIPSYNNAHTINYVVYQAAKGLETNFPNLRSVIFVSDGNSTDGTLESAGAMRLPFRVEVLGGTYEGVSGKGSAVKAIFEAAKLLEVQAVALVDSDLRSITPDWIRLLMSPALSETDFVAPFYVRDKYDGTITNFLCYPVTSCLYGKNIRQPIGGDFGLSINLVEELLESPLWQTEYVPRFGIDIFETHTALSRKLEVKQAFLGSKVHEAKDPAKQLGSMFRQVVGSMFTCIEQYEEAWKQIRGIQTVEIIGEQAHVGTPEPVQVNLQNLIRTWKGGFDQYEKIYHRVLSSDLFRQIEELKRRNDDTGSFSPENWARAVFSFVVAFRKEKQRRRERLLDALRILWIGKIASFVQETLMLDNVRVEKTIEKEVRAFQKLKPYLIDDF